MRTRVYYSLLALVLVLGLAFRLGRLDARPMHHDEANQAVKFGVLLETGEYRYDQADHHGPTLYYLTLPAAWLRGQRTLAALDETTVRLVPALFGGALVLLLGLLGVLGSDARRTEASPQAPRLGPWAGLAAALLAAVSPALTYYARFYIQETLFAFFALAFLVALGRYVQRPGLGAALIAGLLAGLTIATKETWMVVLPAAVAACVVASLPAAPPRRGLHIVLAAAVALAVTFLFYSSFFTNPAGLAAWARSLSIYGARGVTGGAHQQPWWYYLRLLGYWRADGIVSTEALVLGLAAVGTAFAAAPRASFWPRCLATYAVLTAAAFSSLSYKTPWNLLPFYVGLVAMAGFGAERLVRAAKHPAPRAALIVVLAAATTQLALQDRRANFRYAADPRNPYAYAQTTSDFLGLVQRVHDVGQVDGQGDRMLVAVVAGAYEQWPLPWYLRRMPNVGYWSRADATVPLDRAPVIVASETNAAALDDALGDRYVSEYYGLRPDVLMRIYIERGLWERFIAGRR